MSTPRCGYCRVVCLLTLALAVLASPVHAQYFGRNKVQYENFDFRVLKTEHFDIYFYPPEEAAASHAARIAERWYARFSSIFDHELSGRQPLILYASAPEFQQTNAVGGSLGEGTGGVTEALRRRIVLPTGGTLGDLDHVIGHELVHAFQYDITGSGRPNSPSLPACCTTAAMPRMVKIPACSPCFLARRAWCGGTATAPLTGQNAIHRRKIRIPALCSTSSSGAGS